MIWDKFEVLRALSLRRRDGTNWTDNRLVVMLAGIKADPIKFRIGRD